MGLGLYLMPSLLLILGWWSIRGVDQVGPGYLLILNNSTNAPLITSDSGYYAERRAIPGHSSLALAILVLLTMKDAVIIKSVSVMAVMNNPDVLMISIAFSIPWGGVYLSLLPLIVNLGGYPAIAELTVPLALTPLLYRFRHSLKMERRKMLFYLTIALGAVTMPMGAR